jgi:hypothetical protein
VSLSKCHFKAVVKRQIELDGPYFRLDQSQSHRLKPLDPSASITLKASFLQLGRKWEGPNEGVS